MPRFDELKFEIMYRMWDRDYIAGNTPTSALELDVFLPENMITPMCFRAITALVEEGYLDSFPDGLFLSDKGIQTIESAIEIPASQISLIRKRLQDAVEAEPRLRTALAVPAADRSVTLDHNGAPYQKAIAALDLAITEFRQDHLLNNTWGPEKSVLLRALEAGKEHLADSHVRIATIATTIIIPLRIIRKQYKDAMVAGLVTAGIDHLIPTIEKAIDLLLALLGVA